MIEEGVAKAQCRGERVRFLTLTSGTEALSNRELYEAWNRVRTTLRKSGELSEYLAVVELQERDGNPAPHLHILATGEFVAQRRLSALASGAGFGPIADIRAVRGTGSRSAGGYLVKSLARYATKANASALAESVKAEESSKAKRVRPVRMSRRWFPGGMRAAEKQVLERMQTAQKEQDPGPWFLVIKDFEGNIRTISRPKLVEQGADPRAEERPQGPATKPEGISPAQTARAA
jgi:hypothetical protein